MITFTTATVPFAIVFAFGPVRTHWYDPAVEEQVNDLPDAVAAVPADAEIDTTSAAE